MSLSRLWISCVKKVTLKSTDFFLAARQYKRAIRLWTKRYFVLHLAASLFSSVSFCFSTCSSFSEKEKRKAPPTHTHTHTSTQSFLLYEQLTLIVLDSQPVSIRSYRSLLTTNCQPILNLFIDDLHHLHLGELDHCSPP